MVCAVGLLNCPRLQTQNPANPIYKNMTDCVKKTIKWEGLGGFYKGFISPLWGAVCCGAVTRR